MSKSLIIKPKGKLIKSRWDSKKKKYLQSDVSLSAYSYLFEPCEIDDKVVLKDILLLLNKNLKMFDAIFGNWCKDFVKEGLSSKKAKDVSMDYLELYWRIYRDQDYDTKKPVFAGHIFPSFHGKGKAKKTEDGYKKGQDINWSVSFLSVSDLKNLPVKLEDNTEIYNEHDWNDKSWPVGKPEFSLGHILYGIIWELSFYGPPKKRDKEGSKLLKMSKDIDSGKAKLVPINDLFSDLKLSKKGKTKSKTSK